MIEQVGQHIRSDLYQRIQPPVNHERLQKPDANQNAPPGQAEPKASFPQMMIVDHATSLKPGMTYHPWSGMRPGFPQEADAPPGQQLPFFRGFEGEESVSSAPPQELPFFRDQQLPFFRENEPDNVPDSLTEEAVIAPVVVEETISSGAEITTDRQELPFFREMEPMPELQVSPPEVTATELGVVDENISSAATEPVVRQELPFFRGSEEIDQGPGYEIQGGQADAPVIEPLPVDDILNSSTVNAEPAQELPFFREAEATSSSGIPDRIELQKEALADYLNVEENEVQSVGFNYLFQQLASYQPQAQVASLFDLAG